MVVLWITSLLFPEARNLLEKNECSFSSSGGWVIGAARQMGMENDIELHIACPANVESIVNLEGKNCFYHIYKGPMSHDWPWNDHVITQLFDVVKPDITHIWGTEYTCAIAALRVAKIRGGGGQIVISIQGLMSEVAKHYCDKLSLISILKNCQSYKSGVLRDKYDFYKRGIIERDTLLLANFVIGRTDWDKYHVMKINPSLTYFHCDEILREDFYNDRWEYEHCEKYRIFHSNGSVPYKGLHQVLKSLPIVLKRFPKVKLIVAGPNVLQMADAGNNYAKIIVSTIKHLKLSDYVHFCGPLSAQEMKEQLLKCNVFLLSSSIENSSNALGEAQLLGVPVVASDRGGTPTIIPDENCGLLYSYDKPHAMAKAICQSFNDSALFDNRYVRNIAHKRHSPQSNQSALVDIYHKILQ